MTPDRLDELETLMPDDTPDDARVSVPARDLRDLVALIPVVREAFLWHGSDYNDHGAHASLAFKIRDLKGPPELP